MAHKRAGWLHTRCRVGNPDRFRGGGQNQKWPTRGPGGYRTPATRGDRNTSKQETKLALTHKSAGWLHKPCPHGGSQTLQSGGRNQKWPTSGLVGCITPAACGVPNSSTPSTNQKWAETVFGGDITPTAWKSPTLQSGGQNLRWPTGGPGGYIRLAASEVPHTSRRGRKSEVARKWARWLHNPCHLGGPRRFKAGDKIRCGRQVGWVAT